MWREAARPPPGGCDGRNRSECERREKVASLRGEAWLPAGLGAWPGAARCVRGACDPWPEGGGLAACRSGSTVVFRSPETGGAVAQPGYSLFRYFVFRFVILSLRLVISSRSFRAGGSGVAPDNEI